MAKFIIEGREYESYQLSNNQLLDVVENTTFEEQKEEAIQSIINRFKYNLCCMKEDGETEDDVFARFFSNFVNGKMRSKEHVAERMSREHRYLQQEMFKVCLEYIKALAKSYEAGRFDPRNEWSCKMSNSIIEHLKNTNQVF